MSELNKKGGGFGWQIEAVDVLVSCAKKDIRQFYQKSVEFIFRRCSLHDTSFGVLRQFQRHLSHALLLPLRQFIPGDANQVVGTVEDLKLRTTGPTNSR